MNHPKRYKDKTRLVWCSLDALSFLKRIKREIKKINKNWTRCEIGVSIIWYYSLCFLCFLFCYVSTYDSKSNSKCERSRKSSPWPYQLIKDVESKWKWRASLLREICRRKLFNNFGVSYSFFGLIILTRCICYKKKGANSKRRRIIRCWWW